MTPNLRDLRRRQNDFTAELVRKGWYHSFELPDGTLIQGTMPVAWERERWSRFPFPADLTGRRLLDIGAWDGWFSFEAERRGARVTSVDCVEVANYRRMHRILHSCADYRNLDLYELPAAGLGRFDYVLCLGVLYHLRHPLLGLEIVCSLATEAAVIETFVTDSATWRDHVHDIPTLEFYETDELNGNFDNWAGPTVGCLLAMCRAAGFARVELLAVDRDNAAVACYRKHAPPPDAPARPAPELISVVNATTGGINFSLTRDEYLTCLFRCDATDVRREDLCLEIGGLGAPATAVKQHPQDGWYANFRLPPGTPQGWLPVRLRLHDSGFGAAHRIAVAIPPVAEALVLHGAFDGIAWSEGAIAEFLTCWVAGLPENADLHNVRLWLDHLLIDVAWVGPLAENGFRQVNAAVPADYPRGNYQLIARCGGAASNALAVTLQ